MMDIGISTLWGEIISLEVDPNTTVGALKQQCMAARPPTPCSVNVDLSEIMTDAQSMLTNWAYWDGVRIVNFDKNFLDDGETIGSQLVSDECVLHDFFFVKMVYMKQTHLSRKERKWAGWFYRVHVNHIIQTGKASGQQWMAMPVWGKGDRSQDILGVFYQHTASQDHCEIAYSGVDPRTVDPRSVQRCDVPAPIRKHKRRRVLSMD